MAGVQRSADSRRGARYAIAMRYAQGGGLTAEECARRERVRPEAAAWGEEGAPGRGGALPAQLGPAGGAADAARGRPGGVGLGGSVLDAAAHRRGRPRAVRRG